MILFLCMFVPPLGILASMMTDSGTTGRSPDTVLGMIVNTLCFGFFIFAWLGKAFSADAEVARDGLGQAFLMSPFILPFLAMCSIHAVLVVLKADAERRHKESLYGASYRKRNRVSA